MPFKIHIKISEFYAKSTQCQCSYLHYLLHLFQSKEIQYIALPTLWSFLLPFSQIFPFVYVLKKGHSQSRQSIFYALDVQNLNAIPHQLGNSMKTASCPSDLAYFAIAMRLSMWLDLKTLRSLHITTPSWALTVYPFFSPVGHSYTQSVTAQIYRNIFLSLCMTS